MSQIEFPYEIKEFDDHVNEEHRRLYPGAFTKYIRVGPKNYIYQGKYRHCASKIYNMEVRPDDVWIVTLPRSGTSVTQEMMWLIKNNLDFENAKSVRADDRFRYLEGNINFPDETFQNISNPDKHPIITRREWDILGEMEGKRFIKSHLPFSLLPPNLLDVGAKVVYVLRNPKDLEVSLYHFEATLPSYDFKGSFAEHWKLFTEDSKPNSNYWNHIDEALQRQKCKNLLIIHYEDIIADIKLEIKKVANFLETPLNEAEVNSLGDYLKIDNFKKTFNRKYLNVEFVRRGIVGSWREMFDEHLDEEANTWIEENMKKYNINLPSISECLSK